MQKFMKWFQANQKKAYLGIGGIVVAIVLVLGLALTSMNQEHVMLRSNEVAAEVNLDIDQKVETYLDGVKNPDDAKVNFDEVDVKKLGEYEGTIVYKEETYTIKFIVKDTVKPIIKANKASFVFSLDTGLQDVNDAINEEMSVTDNYDKTFDPISVITEVPGSESEIEVKVSIKDTSGNESVPVMITVQFTEDGEEKEELEKIEATASNTYKPVEKTPEETPNEEVDQPSNEGSLSNGSTGGSTSNGGNSSKHTPSPTPTPETTPPAQEPTPTPPTPPVQESDKPTYVTPTGAYNLGLFDDEDEGFDLGRSISDDEKSPYSGWRVHGDELSNGQWHIYLIK